MSESNEETKLPLQDAVPSENGVPSEWLGTAQEKQSARTSATSRRSFLFKLAAGVNALVGLALAAPIVGYLLGPALKKRDEDHAWIKLGTVDAFPRGETRLTEYTNPITAPSDGETAKVACWVRHTEEGTFQIFAINCAHLGCPVRWFEQSKLFLCPCHGGAYYEDGSRASGPPERGLFQYQHRIDGGDLMILAGQMPTMSNEACAGRKPLVEIAPADSEQRRTS
jgi:Rieske Fe-S protein